MCRTPLKQTSPRRRQFEAALAIFVEGIRMCGEQWLSEHVQNNQDELLCVKRGKYRQGKKEQMDNACDFMREEHQLLQSQWNAYKAAQKKSCSIM